MVANPGYWNWLLHLHHLKFHFDGKRASRGCDLRKGVIKPNSGQIGRHNGPGNVTRTECAEEFIDGLGSALLHLLDQNTFVEELDVYPDEVPDTDPDCELADDEEFEDELEIGVVD